MPFAGPAIRPGGRTRRAWARSSRRTTGPAVFLAVALLYVALAHVTRLVDARGLAWSALWPGAGLALGSLLLVGRGRRPWVLAAVAAGEASCGVLLGHPGFVVVGWTMANVGQPLVAVWLMQRLGNPNGVLVPVRKLTSFLVAGAIVAPLAGATVGATLTALEGTRSFVDAWPSYYVGMALGVLVVAPLLLARRMRPAGRSRREAAGMVGATIAIAALIAADSDGSWTVLLPFLVLPVMGWAALRFGVRGTTWLCLALATATSAATALGAGPFMRASGSPEGAMTLLQIFLTIAVSFALLLTALASDLRDRDRLERALRFQASHDSLTGLANRAFLNEVLEHALAEQTSGEVGVGLLVCDIDHFKTVNDRVGHPGGDRLLLETARRLRAAVRPGDVVGRISGDEFVVLLRDVDAAGADAVAQRIIAATSGPVALQGHREVRVSLSVGAAVAGPGESAESVFQAADQALFLAKRQGRGRSVQADDRLRRQARDQTRIENELADALAGGQFDCVFQPIVEVATGRVVAFESTPRWHHPTRGPITPHRFMPAVEATGMLDSLFQTVLAQSLAARSLWTSSPGDTPVVAVNISSLQLGGAQRLEFCVAEALKSSGTRAECLWLDVSEGAPLDEAARRSLQNLLALGVHLSLDGFGGPRSSVASLRACDWGVLKLERSFATDRQRDEDDDMVRAVTTMARTLGVLTVADGVETTGQLDRMRALGCDLAQGRYFGAPVGAVAAGHLVDAHGRWRAHPRVPDQDRVSEELPAQRC